MNKSARIWINNKYFLKKINFKEKRGGGGKREWVKEMEVVPTLERDAQGVFSFKRTNQWRQPTGIKKSSFRPDFVKCREGVRPTGEF